MILKELSEAIGVSGKEDAVRKVVLDAIKGHAQDITIDAMGSVTALKPGTAGRNLRVMLAAHMDEVGFIVTGFEGDGLIRFAAIGGIDDRILPGLRVKIGDSNVPGVILWSPIHHNKETNVVKLANLRIDIGATSKDEANGKIKLGDRIAFDSTYMQLGDKMLRGKAFDDRVGCSLLVDVLQSDSYPVDLIAAFTVQEEIGLRGAQVVAQRCQPDIVIALEGAPCFDLPNPLADADDTDEPNPIARLRGGPVITVMDASLIAHPGLVAFLKRIAAENGIPYQHKMKLGGGTDAGAIHQTGLGAAAVVISVPCRYIHTPTAMLHRDDYDNALKLVKAALHALTPEAIRVS